MHAPGRTYRLTKDLLGYTDAGTGLVAAGINQMDKSATFVISTVKEDREGDVMIPDGCRRHLPSYQKNPVVLFDHNQHLQAIGLSVSPHGVLGIKIEPGRVVATCWYHLKTRESRDCWRGVCGGWLRGASVGFVPHTFEQIDPRKGYRATDDGSLRRKPGYLHSEWELSEWSNVVLPMQDEALLMSPGEKSLDAIGKSMGRSVESRLIRKSLESAGYPVTGIWSPGVTIARGSNVANLRTRYSTKNHKNREKVVKAFAAQGVDPSKWLLNKTNRAWVFVQKATDDDEDKEKKKPVEEEEFDDDKPADDKEKPAEKTKSEEPEPVKLGAQALADVHRHHTGLTEYIDSMRPHIDHEKVMGVLDEHHAGATEAAERIAAAAAEHYPDVKFDELAKPPETKSEDAVIPDDDDDGDGDGDGMDDDEEEDLDDIEEDEEEEYEDDEDDDEKPAEKRARLKKKKLKIKRMRINKSGAMCIKEAAEFLDEMGNHEKVPKSLQAGSRYHSKQLTGLSETGQDMGGEQAKDEDDEDIQSKSRDSSGQGANTARENEAMWARMREDDDISGPDKAAKRAIDKALKVFSA